VLHQDGTLHPHEADPVTQRFAYLPFHQNLNSVLAQWDTNGDEKWKVRLTTFDGGGSPLGTDEHVIQLDNTAPAASIEITSGSGNCGKFPIGAFLQGNYVATDDNLGGWSIGIEPDVNDPDAVTTPSSGSFNTSPSPGDPWSLDTTGMTACGYVVRIVASDRAIINSQKNGHHTSDSAGFCLEELPI
jgi:hypothetical protein